MTQARETRQRLGLDQTKAASLLGMTQGNYSKYESGALRPSAQLRPRLSAFAQLRDDSIFLQGWLMTAANTAHKIKTELKAGEDDHAFRMLVQGSNDLRRLSEPSDIALFLAEPSTTGDRRYDTFLATLIGWRCEEMGIERPLWTMPEPLEPAWNTGGDEDDYFARKALKTTPEALRAYGVLVDAGSLR